MKGKRVYSLIVISIIFIYTFTFWKASINNDNIEAFKKDDGVITTTNEFLRALTEEKTEKAMEMSVGSVRYSITNNKNKKKGKYTVIDINSEIESSNDNLNIVNSIIEIKNKESGEIDVGFLRVYKIKRDDNFKVFRVEDIEPILDSDINNNDKELDNIKSSFISYIKYLENNKYKKAGRFLIGQAKKAHNQTMKLIKDTKLIENPRDFKTEITYFNTRNAIANCSYFNNDKKITAVVSFYKTSEGWKIYNVSKI